jgi:hypothetical protein
MQRTSVLWEVFVLKFEDALGRYRKRRLTAEEAGELLGMSGRHFCRLMVRYAGARRGCGSAPAAAERHAEVFCPGSSRRSSRLIVLGDRRSFRAITRTPFPASSISMIVARSASCKCR